MERERTFQSLRDEMVDSQIVARGVRNPRLLDALRHVPRHEFVPPDYRYSAYADGPLPIGNGQTISQPYIVALMTELLELKGNEVVLEIGTGSGYQAAVLSELVKEVHTVERHAALARIAQDTLSSLGYDNIHIHIGDGSNGLEEFAPYDGILVTAAAPAAPQPLLDQLADGACLVIPVGGHGNQSLECWRRMGERCDCENILSVAFVPLIGDKGWKE